jgi:hypothetical protein
MDQTYASPSQEDNTRESMTLLNKLKLFVKKHWFILLLVCLAVWWFYFRSESRLSMFSDDLSSDGSAVKLNVQDYRLSGHRGLTTTPDGLRRFLR